MFTKIDKKVLIILIITLIIILASVFLIYKYIGSGKTGVENTTGGVSTEEQKNQENSSKDNNTDDSTPQVEIKAEGITGDPSNGGMLIVCVDKCGDGVCQPAGTACVDSLNCICAETKADCPGDCK